jgi:hypothetical protein
MKLLHIPTPSRLLNVFASRRAPVLHRAEPLLGFEHLPPPPAAPQPLGRRAIEMALEEGSSRFYVPMSEAEVLDRPRRR